DRARGPSERTSPPSPSGGLEMSSIPRIPSLPAPSARANTRARRDDTDATGFPEALSASLTRDPRTAPSPTAPSPSESPARAARRPAEGGERGPGPGARARDDRERLPVAEQREPSTFRHRAPEAASPSGPHAAPADAPGAAVPVVRALPQAGATSAEVAALMPAVRTRPEPSGEGATAGDSTGANPPIRVSASWTLAAEAAAVAGLACAPPRSLDAR